MGGPHRGSPRGSGGLAARNDLHDASQRRQRPRGDAYSRRTEWSIATPLLSLTRFPKAQRLQCPPLERSSRPQGGRRSGPVQRTNTPTSTWIGLPFPAGLTEVTTRGRADLLQSNLIENRTTGARTGGAGIH